MKITTEIGDEFYEADLTRPLDISIPIEFSENGLTAFGAASASAKAYAAGDYIGDVRQGGSCNCDVLNFAPHLHGTHTECVGHISHERISISNVFKGGLTAATLITIHPVLPSETDETYAVEMKDSDAVITRDSMQNKINKDEFLESLIIRTSPNNLAKKTGKYSTEMPPYFTTEVMEFIAELPVKHLLIDTPSVDRLEDDGKLSNHRIYWQVEQGESSITNPSPRTISELIYVPDDIKDGNYLLDLQVAAFKMDAAPSHPLLYEVTAK